jgi:hypothetical protein
MLPKSIKAEIEINWKEFNTHQCSAADPNPTALIRETDMTTEITTPGDQIKNQPVYTPPAIVHELKLETRAGSPLGVDPIFDPLGVDPTAK